MQLSHWEYDRYFKKNDIVIIGAGIVGLNTAIALKTKNRKLNILIVERGFLPYGASTRNAGFACIGSASEILDDISMMEEDEVFKIVEKRWLGLQKLRSIVGDKNMNFKPYGGYELFTQNNSQLFESCAQQLTYLNKNLFSIVGKKNTFELNTESIKTFQFKGVKQLIKNKVEGQIDTGKMMDALINISKILGIKIITGLNIKSLNDDGDSVKITTSENFDLMAKKVIVCTNGFAKDLLPSLAVEPARAQVFVTKPIKKLALKGSFHYDKGYYYFRNIGNRILLGGGRNLDFKTENTSEMELTSLVQNQLLHLLKTVIIPNQEFEIERAWSGIMGIGATKKPIIKSISKHLFCAVRMGGMGIAIGSLVGEEVAEMVL